MASQRLPEDPPEPLNHKTWVLRVSIHCEGCKKKVKKILSQVQGVYAVDIDIKQQKATVTGNIEGDTLLKKLLKSGKNAELWPQQQAIHMETKPAKSKNKEKQEADQQEKHHHEEAPKPSGDNNNKEIINPPVKIEAAHNPDGKKKIDGKKVDHGGDEVKESVKNGGSAVVNGDDAAKVVVNGSSKEAVADDQVTKESKSEGKKPETGSAGGKPPVQAEQKGGEEMHIDGGAEKNVAGRNGKKKKTKGQNGNYSEGEPSNVAPTSIRSQNHNTGPLHIPMPANDGPPRHHMYNDYPPPSHGPHYYPPPPSLPLPPHGPPPPVYGVSYNTSYPTTSYTGSYYAPPPPNAYIYSSYPPPDVQQPPPSYLDSYQTQPDSYEMFSDENPNGCSIM